MEAGMKRLNWDTLQEVNTAQVNDLKTENTTLKYLTAEFSLDNRYLKKNLNREG